MDDLGISLRMCVYTHAEIERVGEGDVLLVFCQHFSSVPVKKLLLAAGEGHEEAEHIEIDDGFDRQYFRTAKSEVGVGGVVGEASDLCPRLGPFFIGLGQYRLVLADRSHFAQLTCYLGWSSLIISATHAYSRKDSYACAFTQTVRAEV